MNLRALSILGIQWEIQDYCTIQFGKSSRGVGDKVRNAHPWMEAEAVV